MAINRLTISERLSVASSAPNAAGRSRSPRFGVRRQAGSFHSPHRLRLLRIARCSLRDPGPTHFSGASTQGQPDAVVRPRADAELVELETLAGERVVALFGAALTAVNTPDADAVNRPTMIYFYGNGNCLNQALPEFDRFRQLGLNVLIADYVGYGMSGGVASEQGCRRTADAAYDYLVVKRKVDPKRIDLRRLVAGWRSRDRPGRAGGSAD